MEETITSPTAAKRPPDSSAATSTAATDRSESSGGGGGGASTSGNVFSPTSTTATSSSKRRHTASSATSAAHFRPPPPPLKLSSGETVFRILCPADRTGCVIGKGGSVVRQIREETGARVRVDDPAPGCDDRVILVTAPETYSFRKKGRKRSNDGSNGDDDGGSISGDEEGASPAQVALVRVFERIVRGNEERSGEEVEKERSAEGSVVCRLLAQSGQVGCVLGKGGKVVEKIRQESGAHIRIYGAEQNNACAFPGDELIMITGSYSSAKKALLSVSSCLQDNPRTDGTNFATGKPVGTILRGIDSCSPNDPFVPRGYGPGLHSPDYLSRGFSSIPGPDNFTAGHRKILEEELVFRLLCSNDKVGSLIGKGGSIVRGMQIDTGASIKNSELKHSPAQDAVIRVHSRIAEIALERGMPITARLLVPSQQIGCLLGKGGNIIAEMRRSTGASIRIFLREHVPTCGTPNDEVVQVSGNLQCVQDALFQITSRIRDIIFPLRPHSNHYMPAGAEVPHALFRSRNEPRSPGHYSAVGLGHALDRQSSLSHGPPPHILDHHYDRNPFSYGSDFPARPPFDHPSPPGPWGPQHPRSMPGMGMGFGYENGGSGSVSRAMATSMTTEVVVPQQYLESVYGENGSNLNEIREISGASVTVHDPKPGSAEGVVIISGDHEQTHAAQSLLHAFILCGQSFA
ncbi:KH domain-containing protein [Acorus calamus]|uniref:KH domain-containing protein n=1 Tax=Acorus calamus TaxID=4465 RepID=A0AAV9ERN9_ACOCL|nr:KH domain-containing protein [Acorus calamus]